MEILIQRLIPTSDETIGMLSIDGTHFCFTMEDESRDVKRLNETRIPSGRYRLLLRTDGKMNQKYTNKFGKIKHRGMLWLQDIPLFKWVYIHIGNYESDTSGCPLVGYGLQNIPNKKPMVTHSTQAYLDLAAKVNSVLDAGKEVWVTVHDEKTSSNN